MLTGIQERDDIFSHAIAIASTEERTAYIARACGDDAELRRQVEEKVAAHMQAANPHMPANGVFGHGHTGGSHHEAHASAPGVSHQSANAERHPRASMTTWALFLLLAAAAVVSAGVAVLATRGEKQARAEEATAKKEREEGLNTEKALKQELEKSRKERKDVLDDRDRTLAEVRLARDEQQITQLVLDFLQNFLLSAGHNPVFGEAKNLTIREATDKAAAKVAGAFTDRPLVEASIRYVLGSTYLDLVEAKLAVEQLERAYALRSALLGDDNSDTANCKNKLAQAYRLNNEPDKASLIYEKSPTSTAHAKALAVRGQSLLKQKKPIEAELKLRECLTVRQNTQPDDWSTFAAQALLGESLLMQKKYTEAEKLLKSGYQGMKERETKIPGDSKKLIDRAAQQLEKLHEDSGK